MLFEVTLKIWYTFFSVILQLHFFFLLLTMDIPFSFSAQILSLSQSHNPISSFLAFSYLLFFQRCKFTYRTFEKLISWPLFQIWLLSPPHLKSFISLLPSLLPFFFSFFVFSSSFSAFSTFFSSSFYFYHPIFFCFGFYCFLYSFGHLVIFTSPIFQSISELWHISHSILKITFHFYSFITLISILSLCFW